MKNKALFSVLAAGTFWGTMGFFARSLYATGFGPLEVAQTRITTGLLFVGLYILLFNRNLFRVKWKDIWCFLGTGIVSLLLFSTCYFSALNYTSLAVAAILLYTAPFFVMLLSLVLFKERMTGKKVFALLLAFAGCVLVSGIFTAGGTFTAGGLALGICAGFGYALYSIFSRYAIQRGYHPMTITFYTFLLSAVGGVFFTDFGQIATSSAEYGMALWLPMLAYVVLGTVGAYLLYTAGLKHIDNSKASVMAAVEPACATLLQIVVLRVLPDAYTMVGIVLVLGAIVWLNVEPKKK